MPVARRDRGRHDRNLVAAKKKEAPFEGWGMRPDGGRKGRWRFFCLCHGKHFSAPLIQPKTCPEGLWSYLRISNFREVIAFPLYSPGLLGEECHG
jgi:hypothetical protein